MGVQACYACRPDWVDRYADVLQLYRFHDRVPKVVSSRWCVVLLHLFAALHSKYDKIVEVVDPSSVSYMMLCPIQSAGTKGVVCDGTCWPHGSAMSSLSQILIDNIW